MDLGQLLAAIVEFMGSIEGQSVLGIAVGLAQLILTIANSSIGDLAGEYKLLIVTGVSLVATVLGGLASGGSLFAVLFSGVSIAAFQVFIHQIYVQFFAKKALV